MVLEFICLYYADIVILLHGNYEEMFSNLVARFQRKDSIPALLVIPFV